MNAREGRHTNIQTIAGSMQLLSLSLYNILSSSLRILHNSEHRAKLFVVKVSESVFPFKGPNHLFSHQNLRLSILDVLSCGKSLHFWNFNMQLNHALTQQIFIEYWPCSGYSAKPCYQPTRGLGWLTFSDKKEKTLETWLKLESICHHNFQE